MTTKRLDVRGAKCPIPIVKAKNEMDVLAVGDVLEVLATDPGSMADFRGWVKTARYAALRDQRVDNSDASQTVYVHVLEKIA
jgi:TusA-related sulfurtransferase